MSMSILPRRFPFSIFLPAPISSWPLNGFAMNYKRERKGETWVKKQNWRGDGNRNEFVCLLSAMSFGEGSEIFL